jgi:hypothetical protein
MPRIADEPRDHIGEQLLLPEVVLTHH